MPPCRWILPRPIYQLKVYPNHNDVIIKLTYRVFCVLPTVSTWPQYYKRGQPFKLLQGASHRWRRGSAFSVGVVKYWNKLPASIFAAPSVNILKKQLEKVFTEVFSHLLHWLNTHPTPLSSPPFPTCIPPINSYHLYVLPNSLLYICGIFRPVVAYF